ncbi:hypothetical protein SLA2020_289710 [Shorea laevis]
MHTMILIVHGVAACLCKGLRPMIFIGCTDTGHDQEGSDYNDGLTLSMETSKKLNNLKPFLRWPSMLWMKEVAVSS